MKVESAVSNDRRQTMLELVEITGRGKPTVHRVLKSDLKCQMHLQDGFLVNYRKNLATCSYNCKLSDAINNLNVNDMRRWVGHVAGKINAQTSVFYIFPSKLAC